MSRGLTRRRSVKMGGRGGVAHKKWANLGAIFRHNMVHCLGKAMDNIRAEQSVMTEALEGVRTSMDEGDEAVPYWQQGDLAFYSKDSLKKRYELRHNEEVVEQLQLWWDTALRSMQSGNDSDAHELVCERYVEFSIRIYKAMIENFDLAEAEQSARDDWEDDSRGEPTLGRERFMDSMFELADVWTHSMEPVEYASFLKTLFAQVVIEEGANTYFWKEVKDIEYGGYAEDEHDGIGEDKAETPRDGADDGAEVAKEPEPEPPKAEPKKAAPKEKAEKEPKAAKGGDGDGKKKEKKPKKGGSGDKDSAATKIQSTARGKAARDKKKPEAPPSKPPKAVPPPAAAPAAAAPREPREPPAKKAPPEKPPRPPKPQATEPKPVREAPREAPIEVPKATAPAPPKPLSRPLEAAYETPMDWREKEVVLKKESDGRVWRGAGKAAEEAKHERMDWGNREMPDPFRRPGEHAGPPGWIMRDGQAVQQIEKRSGGVGLNDGRIRTHHEGRGNRRDALERAEQLAAREKYDRRWQLDGNGAAHKGAGDEVAFGFGAVAVHSYGKNASPGQRGPGAGYTRLGGGGVPPLGPIGGATPAQEYVGPYRVPPPSSMAIVESPRGLVLVASNVGGPTSKEAAAASAAHDARVAAAQARAAHSAMAAQVAQAPRVLPMTTAVPVAMRGGGDMRVPASQLSSLKLRGQNARWGAGKMGRQPRAVRTLGGRDSDGRTVGTPRHTRHGTRAEEAWKDTPQWKARPGLQRMLSLSSSLGLTWSSHRSSSLATSPLVPPPCARPRRPRPARLVLGAELPDARASKDGAARSAKPRVDGDTPSPQGSPSNGSPATATTAVPSPPDPRPVHRYEQAANAARLQQHVPTSPDEVYANIVFADASPERAKYGCLPHLGFGNKKSKKGRRAERRVTGPGLNNPYAQPMGGGGGGGGGGGAAAQLPQLNKQQLVAAKPQQRKRAVSPVRREAAKAANAAGWSANLPAAQAVALHNLNTLPGVYTDKGWWAQPLSCSPPPSQSSPVRAIAPPKPFAIAPTQLPPNSNVLPAIGAKAQG